MTRGRHGREHGNGVTYLQWAGDTGPGSGIFSLGRLTHNTAINVNLTVKLALIQKINAISNPSTSKPNYALCG